MSRIKSLTRALRAAVVAVAGLGIMGTAPTATAVEPYGEPGDPINLTIGYQPYYTQAWTAVIMKEQELWKKYLPEGSEVQWSIGLQGSIIVNAMLAGKHDIGYMGDMPAIVAASNYRTRDLRIVSVLGMAFDQCSNIMVRNDAPDFSSPAEAVKWWEGKRVAVAKGSCTDRTAQAVMKEIGVEPAAYLNQNIEVQTSGFKAGKLDSSIIWEPTASKLVLDGIARKAADAGVIDQMDGGFMTMQASLIEQRPDVVEGWLRAELEAHQFMLNPDNYMEVVNMAHKNTQGFSKEALWMSLAGKYPEAMGGRPFRNINYYGFNEDADKLLKDATAFLHEIKSVSEPELREEAVLRDLTGKIVEENDLEIPLGRIESQPPESFPGGAITIPGAGG